MPLLFSIFFFFATCAPTLCAVTFSYQNSLSANADTFTQPTPLDYACILSDNAFFYSAADERRGLFLLPKSYYVRLLEYRSDYCKIEYQRDANDAKRLVGYAKTDDLTFVEYVPARPYLYYTFDLSYTIDGAPSGDDGFLTELTVSCIYYGDYRIGSEMYCYVLRGDEFGYVPKPSGIFYEENSEYADWLAAQTPPEDLKNEAPMDGTNGENSTPAQIAILVVICLLVPILAAMILKPPRRPPYQTEE